MINKEQTRLLRDYCDMLRAQATLLEVKEALRLHHALSERSRQEVARIMGKGRRRYLGVCCDVRGRV